MNRREVLASAAGAYVADARRHGRKALPGELGRELEAQARSAHVAGAAVVVARGGATLASWTYGCANLPFQTPVTSRTLFNVASVAKHVTALGVLKLVDRGALQLDAPVRDHLALLPRAWGDRTIRSLLTHTSGLPDFTLAPKRPPQADDPTREQLVAQAQFRAPLFGAGEGWSYCNTNYLLLGWLIEDSVGQPFADAARDWLLRPAGAPYARADGPGVVTPQLAEPYVWDARFWRVPFEQTDRAIGSGTLQLSAQDIAPWGEAITRHRVASAATTAQVFSWARLRSELSVPYGFGWFLDRVAGKPVQWHTGGTPGSTAMLLRLPAEDLTVAVMMNTDPPSRVFRSMAWKAAHAFAPDATYLDRAPLPADPVDARLQALGRTPGPLRPDRDLVAPDFARVLDDPTEQRRFAPGFRPDTRLACIEEYAAPQGRMRRYRVTDAEKTDYKLAGFDAHDRLFWLWSC